MAFRNLPEFVIPDKRKGAALCAVGRRFNPEPWYRGFFSGLSPGPARLALRGQEETRSRASPGWTGRGAGGTSGSCVLIGVIRQRQRLGAWAALSGAQRRKTKIEVQPGGIPASLPELWTVGDNTSLGPRNFKTSASITHLPITASLFPFPLLSFFTVTY
ncbi:hypothetical protein ANANG_G00134800 [Anguilla anguilla]|uniref:Uncharacterized protein n=1 Tax=Anguilla anguilla TaxID=7936 RepID=A0A9D3M9P7_ANGAN|nr:hypothetical protein ANANG_G00134800 [Anguilla anguilla]